MHILLLLTEEEIIPPPDNLPQLDLPLSVELEEYGSMIQLAAYSTTISSTNYKVSADIQQIKYLVEVFD